MTNQKEHREYIFDSDISSVSISFGDAPKYRIEEIIRDSKVASELNERMEVKKKKWRII